MALVDILMTKNDDGYYDINFENGDLSKTDGFETALLMTFLCERRASDSEIPSPKRQRGWWGNAFLGF